MKRFWFLSFILILFVACVEKEEVDIAAGTIIPPPPTQQAPPLTGTQLPTPTLRPTNSPIPPSPTQQAAPLTGTLLPPPTLRPTNSPIPPSPTQQAPPSTGTPLPTNSPTPTTISDSRMQLLQLIKDVHDQYEIDPTRGCFELLSPYEAYHQGLQTMTAILLTHSLAQAFSLEEREDMFAEVTGFDDIKFIPGNGEAVLVSIKVNRGYQAGCGTHHTSPDAFHIVDKNGNIGDIGIEGLYRNSWWIDDRWVVLSSYKTDATSGPTPWAVWHIGQTDEGWHQVVKHEFTPMPYNFSSLPLHFENGYTTMIVDLEYWYADDPCEFSEAFRAAYTHGDWTTKETYALVDGAYQRIDVQVTDFPIYVKDTQTEVSIDNWQDYCLGPILANG